MNTNQTANYEIQTTSAGTAGIPAGANATSRPAIPQHILDSAGAENPTPHVVPPLGGSAITSIPQHILDHAERHYPSASRPKCPIFARNWDRDKQHCIDNRQKIEAQLVTQTSESAVSPQLSGHYSKRVNWL